MTILVSTGTCQPVNYQSVNYQPGSYQSGSYQSVNYQSGKFRFSLRSESSFANDFDHLKGVTPIDPYSRQVSGR